MRGLRFAWRGGQKWRMKSPEDVPFGVGVALLPVVDEDVGVAPVVVVVVAGAAVAGAAVAGALAVFAAGLGL